MLIGRALAKSSRGHPLSDELDRYQARKHSFALLYTTSSTYIPINPTKSYNIYINTYIHIITSRKMKKLSKRRVVLGEILMRVRVVDSRVGVALSERLAG